LNNAFHLFAFSCLTFLRRSFLGYASGIISQFFLHGRVAHRRDGEFFLQGFPTDQKVEGSNPFSYKNRKSPSILRFMDCGLLLYQGTSDGFGFAELHSNSRGEDSFPLFSIPSDPANAIGRGRRPSRGAKNLSRKCGAKDARAGGESPFDFSDGS